MGLDKSRQKASNLFLLQDLSHLSETKKDYRQISIEKWFGDSEIIKTGSLNKEIRVASALADYFRNEDGTIEAR